MTLDPLILYNKLNVCGNAFPIVEAAFPIQTVPEAAAVTKDVSVGTVEEYSIAETTILERS